MEDVLRTIGSAEDWCEKYGAELRHEAARSAQVARMITLGCGGRLAVWGATTVPQDEHGTWWIANAAQYGMDLETYRRLSFYCEGFREDEWTMDRKVRWSQRCLKVVEAEINRLRFQRFVDAVDHEVAAAGAAAPDVGTAAPDAAGAGAAAPDASAAAPDAAGAGATGRPSPTSP